MRDTDASYMEVFRGRIEAIERVCGPSYVRGSNDPALMSKLNDMYRTIKFPCEKNVEDIPTVDKINEVEQYVKKRRRRIFN